MLPRRTLWLASLLALLRATQTGAWVRSPRTSASLRATTAMATAALDGELFVYTRRGMVGRLAAFQSGGPRSHVAVLVGGLTDGPLGQVGCAWWCSEVGRRRERSTVLARPPISP